MKSTRFMFIAGEASGDALAAELAIALRERVGVDAQFFGAGGPKLAAAGAELTFDLTQHSVIGLLEVLKNYAKFKRLFNQLIELAVERRPDAIICVDFSGFNRRFAHAVRQRTRRTALDWQPKIIQYVSPQVWASRPGRAQSMVRDFDLLLAIFPFEKAWYAQRVPELHVEFVGHPVADRFQSPKSKVQSPSSSPLVLLLPGSRVGELKRHLPVMFGALEKMQINQPEIRARMVLPNEDLLRLAQKFSPPDELEIQLGELDTTLREATLAIASTGTVTMECAYFGVPTVALYKTSWSTYQIGKRIIQVEFLAMPNLLAGEEIFPEFIQADATAENISRAALDLLGNPDRQKAIKRKLGDLVASLGGPGASQRATAAIWELLQQPGSHTEV